MKKVLALAALLAVFSLPALAQGALDESTPKFEVGGGYAFRMWNIPASDGSPSTRWNMNGWDANADYNVANYLGVAFDASGTYNFGGVQNGNQDIYTFMVGPQLYPMGHHKLTPFVHAMGGLGRYTLYLPPDPALEEGSFSYSQNRLALSFGGGIDYEVTHHVTVRVAQVDYERVLFTIEQDLPAQNNFVFRAGVEFHFGGR